MTLAGRLLAAVLTAIALLTAGMWAGVRYEKGQQARRDMATQQLKDRAMLRAIDNRDTERQAADATARRASDGYQQELAAARAARDAAVDELRVSAAICTDRDTKPAEATSPGRPDATPPGTVVLPAALARDLLDLARRADEVTAQGRALQEWIRGSGFYPQK